MLKITIFGHVQDESHKNRAKKTEHRYEMLRNKYNKHNQNQNSQVSQ